MARARILVVEDESITALDIQRTLQHLGYEVPAVASSGEEAIDKAAETHPDLVLMDIVLRGNMDGVAAAREIQSRLDIPVVYLTGHADDPTVERAKLTEPFGYILKPFEERELHTSIEMALYKHRAEQALRESEKRFRLLVEGVRDYAIFMLDPTGHVTSWNTGAERIKGYRAEDILGRHFACFYTAEDRESGKPERALRLATVDGRFEEEGWRLRQDGSRFRANVNLTALHDRAGQLCGFAKVTRDVTERMQVEQALAHDLQEPLRVMASFTQLLARTYQGRLDAEADDFITRIVNGAHRMQRLILDLLTYSRLGREGKAFAPTDCTAVLKTALGNLRLAFEESGAAATADPLPTVVGDETQLLQVFQNLIGNAVKFRSDRPIQVHVGARRWEGDWVFSVRDNGIGIKQKYLKDIFLIFERLHSPAEYPGTGIGLAICKKIVEHHGGRIWAESEPGQGSTFYFTLPAAG